MKQNYLLLTLSSLILLTFTPQATAQNKRNSAQNNVAEAPGPRRFWQANLPGGEYIVALSQISSISKHNYIIDGALRVTEVVIDTTGNSLARFYYIVPISEDSGSALGAGLTDRARELLDQTGKRTGVNANTIVAKQYPTTTHAKTVEYRISDERDLEQLFNSARKAWINNTGKKFTIKE